MTCPTCGENHHSDAELAEAVVDAAEVDAAAEVDRERIRAEVAQADAEASVERARIEADAAVAIAEAEAAAAVAIAEAEAEAEVDVAEAEVDEAAELADAAEDLADAAADADLEAAVVLDNPDPAVDDDADKGPPAPVEVPPQIAEQSDPRDRARSDHPRVSRFRARRSL